MLLYGCFSHGLGVLILNIIAWLLLSYTIATNVMENDCFGLRRFLPLYSWANVVLVMRVVLSLATCMLFGIGLPDRLKSDCNLGMVLLPAPSSSSSSSLFSGCSSLLYSSLSTSSFLSTEIKGGIGAGFILFIVGMGLTVATQIAFVSHVFGCGKSNPWRD